MMTSQNILRRLGYDRLVDDGVVPEMFPSTKFVKSSLSVTVEEVVSAIGGGPSKNKKLKRLSEMWKASSSRIGEISEIDGDLIRAERCLLYLSLTGTFDHRTVALTLYVARAMGECESTVGYVAPLQDKFELFDLSEWDSSELRRLIFSRMEERYTGRMYPIGRHISKGSDLSLTLRSLPEADLPVQIFVSNPKSGVTPNLDVRAVSEVIGERSLKVFIHTPYILNLSSEERKSWTASILSENCSVGVSSGCKGVVVHTGARVKRTEEQALDTMEEVVRSCLSSAGPSCPILLETPCGEGTEVVTTVESLRSFFYRFSEEERRHLGLCVDTCHVFAAGYDPLEYLHSWYEDAPVPVRLIHFNDSVHPCGSYKDRHALVGSGEIGYDRLMSVSEWAGERDVPMIIE